MKVYLRDTLTRYYLGTGGEWVEGIGLAAEFGTLTAAGRTATNYGGDLEVVLLYEDAPSELALNPAYCVARRVGQESRMAA